MPDMASTSSLRPDAFWSLGKMMGERERERERERQIDREREIER